MAKKTEKIEKKSKSASKKGKTDKEKVIITTEQQAIINQITNEIEEKINNETSNALNELIENNEMSEISDLTEIEKTNDAITNEITQIVNTQVVDEKEFGDKVEKIEKDIENLKKKFYSKEYWNGISDSWNT